MVIDDAVHPEAHGPSGDASDIPQEAPVWVPGQAFQALAAQNWALAAQIVEENWPLLISHHLNVLRAVAEALPDDFLRANPRWVTVRQYIGNLLMSPRVRPSLYPRTRRLPASKPLDVLAQLAEASLEARSRGDFAEAVALAARGVQLAHSEPSLTRAGSAPMLPSLLFHLGVSFELACDEKRAMAVLQEAYTSAVREGDLRAAADSSGELAWIHTMAGRGEQAEAWISCHLAITSVSPTLTRLRSTIHLAIASRMHDRLERDRAREELEHARGTGMDEHWMLVLAHRAIFGAFAERPDPVALLGEIEAQIAGSERQASGMGVNRLVLDAARALTLCHSGQPEAALRIIDQNLHDGGIHAVYSIRAAAHYSLGDFAAAERDADQAVRDARTWPRSVVQALAVKAAVAWQQTRERDAVDAFRQAVKLALANSLLPALAYIPRAEFNALRQLTFGDAGPAELDRLAAIAEAFFPPVAGRAGLTVQEERVMRELARGVSLKLAAARLNISQNTVKAHTRSIYRKLGVSSREEMLAEAHRRGLLHN